GERQVGEILLLAGEEVGDAAHQTLDFVAGRGGGGRLDGEGRVAGRDGLGAAASREDEGGSALAPRAEPNPRAGGQGRVTRPPPPRLARTRPRTPVSTPTGPAATATAAHVRTSAAVRTMHVCFVVMSQFPRRLRAPTIRAPRRPSRAPLGP